MSQKERSTVKHDISAYGKLTIGVDVGDRYSHVCVLDEGGQIVREERVRTIRDAVHQYFHGLDPSVVAMEAGNHSPWISRLVTELGHEVLVANARKLRAIYTNPQKCDRRDAEMLARLARVDPELLGPIRHRSAPAQADLILIRSRDLLVRTRTALINHVRSMVKVAGARLVGCSVHAFHKKSLPQIPPELRPALVPVLQQIAALQARIQAFDGEIRKLCRDRYPETSRLLQVHGVGPITALTFVLTLEDPDRFDRSRSVGAYLGLVPRRDDSGDRRSQLPISKAGNNVLRSLLVGCAQYILGPFGKDGSLRRWGLELARRGGKNAKKRAAVAVARKLSVLLHRLWVSGSPFDPWRNGEDDQLAA
jgi:transposase